MDQWNKRVIEETPVTLLNMKCFNNEDKMKKCSKRIERKFNLKIPTLTEEI